MARRTPILMAIVAALSLGAAALLVNPFAPRPVAGPVAEASVPAVPESTPVGRAIDDFTLHDVFGRPHDLAEWADYKLLVVAFLGTECPLSKLYGPRLDELAQQFGPRGVAFVGVNPNAQDSLGAVADFVRLHNITFPIFKDINGTVADRMGAVRTPEVFVLDAGRVVRYWGRIDDQYGVRGRRPAPTRRNLADALGELLDGRPVARPAVPSVGCRIGRADAFRRRRRGDLYEPDQPDLATPLRRLPPGGRTGSVSPDRLPRRRRLVGHDPRGGR